MEFSNQTTGQTEFKAQEDFPEKRRKVQWSVELEVVHYFVPLPQKSESRWKKKIKHLKEKALDPMLLLLDSDAVQSLQNGLECLMKKINGRSEELDFDNIRGINQPWDELFELYTTREEISRENNVGNNFTYLEERPDLA